MPDTSQFPAAEDFEIVLFGAADEPLGIRMGFVSRALDAYVGWDYWDDVDRMFARWTLDDIPLGSVDAPFVDIDQYWGVEVWQADGWVHIAYGDGEVITTRMKVPVERYLDQWRQTLDRCRRP